MRRENLLLLSGVLILSACGTPPLTDDQQCQKFGAIQGSNAYIDCMSKLANRDAIVEKKREEADEAKKKQDEEDAQHNADQAQQEQEDEGRMKQLDEDQDQLMQSLAPPIE